MKKANHKCKWSGCTLGKDGGRKEYYACDYCDATENWKSMACCKEHYDLYVKEILEARAKGESVDTLPERTDMTKAEVKKLKNKSLKEVKAKTEAELKDYADEDGEVDILEAVNKINEELDSE